MSLYYIFLHKTKNCCQPVLSGQSIIARKEAIVEGKSEIFLRILPPRPECQQDSPCLLPKAGSSRRTTPLREESREERRSTPSTDRDQPSPALFLHSVTFCSRRRTPPSWSWRLPDLAMDPVTAGTGPHR